MDQTIRNSSLCVRVHELVCSHLLIVVRQEQKMKIQNIFRVKLNETNNNRFSLWTSCIVCGTSIGSILSRYFRWSRQHDPLRKLAGTEEQSLGSVKLFVPRGRQPRPEVWPGSINRSMSAKSIHFRLGSDGIVGCCH
jgi:hypothetical protein